MLEICKDTIGDPCADRERRDFRRGAGRRERPGHDEAGARHDRNVRPVITEAFERAATPLTPEQRELALKCWKDSVCETGHGTLTVAYADGFGENVWRRVTAMEFIEQALTYPDVKKIIYTSARGDASKAIADMRSYIAQKVDVIVMFADAGEALLPTVKEATEAGILVTVHNGTSVGGEAGKDFVTSVAEDICKLGTDFVKAIADNTGADRHRRAWRHARQSAQRDLARLRRQGDRQPCRLQADRQGRHQLDAGRQLRGGVRPARPA